MSERRTDSHSQLDALRQSRVELVALILGTVILGLDLNLMASLVYDLWINGEELVGHRLALLMAGVAVSLIVVALLTLLLYSRSSGAAVPLEVAIPYSAPEGQPIQVVTPVPYRPPYPVVALAHRRFMAACGERKPYAQEILEERRAATTEGKSFASFMAPWHKALVDCLILDALHDYGNQTLGSRAAYESWVAKLECQAIGREGLPDLLQANKFVQAMLDTNREWRLLLPQHVNLQVLDLQGARSWKLRHPLYGQIVLAVRREYRASGFGRKVGKVLGEGVPPAQQRSFTVLTSRAEASASIWLAFLPSVDPFCSWATGLLAHLEERLDWGYYDNSRVDRMMADLPRLVGDIPEGNSVWGRLDELRNRLARLETQLDGKSSGTEQEHAR